MILDDVRAIPEPASFGIALLANSCVFFARRRLRRSPSIA
jgi:hypothetical protein